MQEEIQNKKTLFASLPATRHSPNNYDYQSAKPNIDTIIVLDDDPTGTQTVYDVPVLTDWKVNTIFTEFEKGTPLFFILTNSRSLTQGSAQNLAKTIGQNIVEAARISNKTFWVISRGDSTLRGHYPEEVTSLQHGLKLQSAVHFIIPAFFEGGRYTVNDVHYVEDSGQLIPAAQTVYAKDHVFGFQSSDLKKWVREKWKGNIKENQISSFSINDFRQKNEDELIKEIHRLPLNSVVIINATEYSDLHSFINAIYKSNIQPIFRTAASFVSAIGNCTEQALLQKEVVANHPKHGGLIVVGSYVSTTTSQLQHLIDSKRELHYIEIDIPTLLNHNDIDNYIFKTAVQMDSFIKAGKTVVLYTSRDLISAASNEEKQNLGIWVSKLITSIISSLSVRPGFILTKGGITSSDIATKALGIRKAMVIGQIIKGVPVWKLGEETKFPGSTQIIFPGNVGSVSSLTEIVSILT